MKVNLSASREKKLLRAYGGCLGVKAEEGRGTLRKASGSRVQALYPGMSEWGNPFGAKLDRYHPAEHILMKGTWGTETSKYPEEQKSFR